MPCYKKDTKQRNNKGNPTYPISLFLSALWGRRWVLASLSFPSARVDLCPPLPWHTNNDNDNHERRKEVTAKVVRVVTTPKSLVNCPLLALRTRFSSSVASSFIHCLASSFYTMFSSQNSNNTTGLPTYSRAVTYSPAKVEVVSRLPTPDNHYGSILLRSSLTASTWVTWLHPLLRRHTMVSVILLAPAPSPPQLS